MSCVRVIVGLTPPAGLTKPLSSMALESGMIGCTLYSTPQLVALLRSLSGLAIPTWSPTEGLYSLTASDLRTSGKVLLVPLSFAANEGADAAKVAPAIKALIMDSFLNCILKAPLPAGKFARHFEFLQFG